MKEILRLLVLCSVCTLVLAQAEPSTQLEVFYQRVEGFDFFSGSLDFDIRDESFNGGGFGFVYHLTDWFGLWSQTGLYGGVQQGIIELKLINQVQGARLTARRLGPINVFAKGGVGFTRYVFETPLLSVLRYGTTFNYGGGVEVQLKEGLLLILDATQMSMSLPDITGSPDRDKWDTTLLLTTGVAFQF